MSMHMVSCSSTAMGRSRAGLLWLVSVAVQTVPCSLLFPLPFLKERVSLTLRCKTRLCGHSVAIHRAAYDVSNFTSPVTGL